jgi:hypothetical protein
MEQDDDADNGVDVSPFAVSTIAGVPLATPIVRLLPSGSPAFTDLSGFGLNGGGLNSGTVAIGAFPNGLYTIESLDFDLDNNAATGDPDGFEIVNGTGLGVFTDGIWTGFGGDTTYIGVLNTLMTVESIATGNAFTAVSGDYVIRQNANATPDFTADALSYLDESDFDYAVGLKYTFDTGMGDLTVGAGWQQGGTIFANQLMVTNAAGASSMVASGTDLTVDTAAGAGELELWESITSAETVEYGISASYAMTNGFSVGFQYSNIENAAAMGYTIAVDSVAGPAGTSATVTNAMFTDATHWGIGAAYTFDAITVAANYGELDYDNGAFADRSGYGAVAQYDFGGGLSAHLGYGYSEVGAANASNWSLGMSMSF